MSIHLHHTRQCAAWILTAFALSPFALCFASSQSAGVSLSPVTGRVTIAGKPGGDLTICLDSDGDHVAFGALGADGTFHLSNMRWIEGGATPGQYHAHLYSRAGGAAIAPKYTDSRTSGIVIDVAPDWNDFRIDLP
jgi:hypothetical protein